MTLASRKITDHPGRRPGPPPLHRLVDLPLQVGRPVRKGRNRSEQTGERGRGRAEVDLVVLEDERYPVRSADAKVVADLDRDRYLDPARHRRHDLRCHHTPDGVKARMY